MLTVTASQVESKWGVFSADERISSVYVPGANRANWNTVAELARQGSPLTVLSRDADTAEFRQFAQAVPSVTVREIPPGMVQFEDLIAGLPDGYGLLVIDEPAWQFDLLRDALATGARPSVIVTTDLAEDAAGRQAKYALLIRMKYHFAGMSGHHSLWTIAKQPAGTAATFLTELPLEIGSQASRGAGVVLLDQVMAPDGDILRLPARAGLSISGWAMISQNESPAAHIFAVARHEETGVAEYLRLSREPRPDVVAHFGTEQLLMTGFRADLAPLCRRVGTHTVTVLQADGRYRYESKPLFRFALQPQEYELAARAGLASRYLYGNGIEIGALQKPLKLSEACRVRYIDRMTIQKLLEHYPEMAQLPLQAPDIVDDGQQLSHIAEDSQDFVIANHFLEHCADPISSIYNMLRVVKQGGIVYLGVPDKRHTFDLLRPVTPYESLKSAYLTGYRSEKAELFYEWAHLVYKLPPEDAKARAHTLMEEDYSIHYNVWTSTDLLSFLLAARQDFQIPFELVAAVSTENEIIVLLERTAGRLLN